MKRKSGSFFSNVLAVAHADASVLCRHTALLMTYALRSIEARR